MDSPACADIMDVDQPLQTPAPPPIEDEEPPRLPDKLMVHEGDLPCSLGADRDDIPAMECLHQIELPPYRNEETPVAINGVLSVDFNSGVPLSQESAEAVPNGSSQLAGGVPLPVEDNPGRLGPMSPFGSSVRLAEGEAHDDLQRTPEDHLRPEPSPIQDDQDQGRGQGFRDSSDQRPALESPVSHAVRLVLEDTLTQVERQAPRGGPKGRRRSSGRQSDERLDLDPLDADPSELPSSPEPDAESETLVDDFVDEFTSEDKRIFFSEEAEDSAPIKEVIVNARMDDEVTEVLQTYMKSQFGELRKRAAIHVLTSDDRIAAYQAELRKMSVPLLRLAQQLDESPEDIEELRRTTGNVLCLMLMLNERMLHDRRRAVLNFFERPDDIADDHRLPRRSGDGLFGKRFCWLNGLGFTKRRPRRKPAPRLVYQCTTAPKQKAASAGDCVHQEPLQKDEVVREEFDEELDAEDEEAVSDEEWKVSEEEIEEEDEADSELESEEQAEVASQNQPGSVNGTGATSNGTTKRLVEDSWVDSVRLMQLADAAVDEVKVKRKARKTKQAKKDKLKKARTEKRKRSLKETGVSPTKRGRKKKVKELTSPVGSLPQPLVPAGREDEDSKKNRRRRIIEDDEVSGSFKRRKKDGPMIERKIDPHCEHCDFEADRRHLIMHVRKEHPDKMIGCDQCDKQFAFKVSLWNHVVIMHGSAKFKCDQCTRSFRSEEKLRMHSFMHSESKPFACEICGKGCLTKRHLDAHVLIHEQRQQLYCQMCDRHFATNHNYRNHMKLHTGQKDFFCDICNAGFPIKARLTQHKRLHHSGEQYVCDVCGKAFKARHILNDHKALRHSNEKSWVCEVCGAGFKLKSVLVRHLKTHSDERPFRCDICDKAFKDRSTLGVHRKTHSTDRPFLCDQCGMSFKRNAERKKHSCVGRMVHMQDDSSHSHPGQLQASQVVAVPAEMAVHPHGVVVSHLANSHVGSVISHPTTGGHHLAAGQRSVPLTTLGHPHPTSLMAPATPGTSLQAQIMQLLDEGLHAAGVNQPVQQQLHHPQGTGNFSVN